MKLTPYMFFVIIGKEKYSDLTALHEVDCTNWMETVRFCEVISWTLQIILLADSFIRSFMMLT